MWQRARGPPVVFLLLAWIVQCPPFASERSQAHPQHKPGVSMNLIEHRKGGAGGAENFRSTEAISPWSCGTVDDNAAAHPCTMPCRALAVAALLPSCDSEAVRGEGTGGTACMQHTGVSIMHTCIIYCNAVPVHRECAPLAQDE